MLLFIRDVDAVLREGFSRSQLDKDIFLYKLRPGKKVADIYMTLGDIPAIRDYILNEMRYAYCQSFLIYREIAWKTYFSKQLVQIQRIMLNNIKILHLFTNLHDRHLSTTTSSY